MSELIQKNDSRATIRWKLLTGASALALTGYIASVGAASADDTSRPLVWIELGGQAEQVDGMSNPFTAPFMTAITPAPDVYKGIGFVSNQQEPRFAFGEEAKITFQPENSDWLFSAGIRYGRSHANRHRHNQAPADSQHYHFTLAFTFYGYPYQYTYDGTVHPSYSALADTKTETQERHTIVDFSAGKDVGLGLFGGHGSSVLNAGVRYASFRENSSAYITARPGVHIKTKMIPITFFHVSFPKYYPTFHQYFLKGEANRSFTGIGPTLSWDASVALAGNTQDGELAFDWGINAAFLFGKQKAKISHHTTATKFALQNYVGTLYTPRSNHSTRSRNVTVPNIGGYAGLSVKYTDVKVSIGYRYDTFLNAMDTGIDAAKKSNVTFNGPFASISIGIGD